MKESQEVMLKFVKIVEQYPELYDSSSDSYKLRHVMDAAWDKIAERVRAELHEECSVDELKLKWKGVRSSFNRYKTKLYHNKAQTSLRKYYLYDSLRFLDIFTKPKSIPRGEFFEFEEIAIECPNEWDDKDIKPNLSEIENTDQSYIHFNDDSEKEIKDESKKRKYEDSSITDRSTFEENEDLQFFKSILPDIKDFTAKEKRKFKKRILSLIDDIEEERIQRSLNNEVSSS